MNNSRLRPSILRFSTIRKHSRTTTDPPQRRTHRNWPHMHHRILSLHLHQRHKRTSHPIINNSRAQTIIKDWSSITCRKHPTRIRPCTMDRNNCIRQRRSANTATLRSLHHRNISMPHNRTSSRCDASANAECASARS